MGWSNFFFSQLPFKQLDSLRVARVLRVDRGRYRVITVDEELTATVAGRLRHEGAEHYPTVGDWVV
ncbi:MAG: hypothetical protein M0R77_16775 [Gammaproteobacteria bacterium]|nr:hypothetical protein [Gammaproteobacteria bacterium]